MLCVSLCWLPEFSLASSARLCRPASLHGPMDCHCAASAFSNSAGLSCGVLLQDPALEPLHPAACCALGRDWLGALLIACTACACHRELAHTTALGTHATAHTGTLERFLTVWRAGWLAGVFSHPVCRILCSRECSRALCSVWRQRTSPGM